MAAEEGIHPIGSHLVLGTTDVPSELLHRWIRLRDDLVSEVIVAALLEKLVTVAFSASLASGLPGPAHAQPSQAWKITARQSAVLAETRIGSMYVRLSGQCKSRSSYVVVSLEGYRGNALRKIDQVEQPVVFLAEGQDGSRNEHRGAMFMFGDEVAMPNSLPMSFVERLAESNRLMIRNATGQPILTVSLAEARRFPAQLSRLCGTTNSQTAEAQVPSGGKASSSKGQLVESLPIRRGFYVTGNTPCGQASNATLHLARRDGFGSGGETCRFKKIERTAPAGYRVTEECRSREGGRPETRISFFDIMSDSSFSVRFNDGTSYIARYCAQTTLPLPWRNNDIRDLIR